MNYDKLREAIKTIPHSTGVYIFSASGGRKILYIGKALDLKNRVKNYQKTPDTRLQRMIVEATKLDFIKTDSDIEALILESQYIKKFQPQFNIMLRDDKQYGYVSFTNENFPKIFITHQPGKGVLSSKYNVLRGEKSENRNTKFLIRNTEFIGPFTDIGALKTALRLLRRVFPYCTCKQLHNNYCLNYHIGKCYGFCCLKNAELQITNYELRTYIKNIKAIKDILSGKKSSLIKKLEEEMSKLGKEQRFENAIELQNKIEKLKRVFQNAQIIRNPQFVINHSSARATLTNLQKILKLNKYPERIECYDIANIQGEYAVGAMVVFTGGQPDKKEYRKFKIRMFGGLTSKHSAGGDTGMLREVLTRRLRHSEWPMPDLIIVDGGKAQLNAAKEVLRITNYELRIKIIALAKNEKHIGHKILLGNNPSFAKASTGKKEILLSKLPPETRNLLLRIDSEAHRFAISYYRRLHRRSL